MVPAWKTFTNLDVRLIDEQRANTKTQFVNLCLSTRRRETLKLMIAIPATSSPCLRIERKQTSNSY